MIRRPLLLIAILSAACASPAPSGPPDVFSIDGARAVLRPRDEAEATEISRHARAFAEQYGFDPRGSLRVLRDLRDVLDDPVRVAALRTEPVVSFGATLRSATGWTFEPRQAEALIRAAAGPPGRAFADPAVPAFLAGVREAGLLHEEAGEDALRLDGAEAAALRELSRRPGAVDAVRRAAGDAFVFHPADAAEWLKPPPLLDGDPGFIVDAVGIRLRTAFLPEVRDLLPHRATVEALVRAARDADVKLAGKGAILVLSRLVTEDPAPPDADALARLDELAGRTVWPDAGDYLFLVRLARARGSANLVADLEDRFRYRYDPRDADALLRLLAAGVPEPALPAWIRRDRVPLTHPGELLGPEPAAAFLDPNDLRFLERLERHRPELLDASIPGLERAVRKRLEGVPLRHRSAAPYAERADDLSRFLRPDLLKALLMLEALKRPDFLGEVFRLLDRDLGRPDSEVGGWVELGPDGRLRLVEHEGEGGEGNDRLRLPVRAEEAALEFHFHATDSDDSAYAGPSSGGPGTDLFRAAHHRLDGLVFTKLTGDAIDCDLYTSGENVLDLGVRKRPQSVRTR